MARSRHQDGWVELSGKKVKQWKGHFYLYRKDADGKETRHHTSRILGKKSEMPKWKAEEKLRLLIEKETGIAAVMDDGATFEWFWENRFTPFQKWSAETRANVTSLFRRNVLPRIGSTKLRDLDKYSLQLMMQSLEGKSKSMIDKAHTYVRACLDEAVEQDVIAKNPARKLMKPEHGKVCKHYLSIEAIAVLLAHMEPRDRLICQIALVCGLRPGELFACRWDDLDEEASRLRIDESASDEGLRGTKTKESTAWVWLPRAVLTDILAWRQVSGGTFIFPSKAGTPLRTKNFLRRQIWPAAIRAGLMAKRPADLPKGTRWVNPSTSINFRAFRRTCATWLQKYGTTKDVQSHLRHATAAMTLGTYIQDIPESVRLAVEALNVKLFEVAKPPANLRTN